MLSPLLSSRACRFGQALACVFGLSVVSSSAVRAASLLILNPSFETPVTAPGTFVTDAAPSGWSTYGNIHFFGRAVGVLNPASTTLYLDPAPQGANVGVVFLLDAGPAVESGLVQTLADTLQTETRYVLTVAVGNIANDANPPHNSFDFAGFPGYRVDLLAGGTVIASDDNTLLPGEGRFLTSTVEISIGASHALAGQALGIRLVNLDGAEGIEVNFDDVRLEATPVPEPAGAASLFGLVALAGAVVARARTGRAR